MLVTARNPVSKEARMADPITIYGTPVVQGVAYAPALWVRRPELPPESAPALPEDVREA